MRIKKQMIFLIMFTLAFTIMPSYKKEEVFAMGFKDLKTSHWAYSDIMYFVNEGEIGGFPDGTFKPEKEISRAEFVTIITRFVDSDDAAEHMEKPFKDPKNWADEAIRLAVNLGVIIPAEYGDYFNPNTSISRLEMAKMVSRALATYDDSYRLALTQTLNTKLPFADLTKLAKENVPFVAVASGTNLINGYIDDTFRPTNKATRAEAVAILARLKRLGNSDKTGADFKELQEYVQLSTLGNNIEAVTGIKVKDTKDIAFTFNTWSIKFKKLIVFDTATKNDAFYPMFKNITYARDNYMLAAEVEITSQNELSVYTLFQNVIVNTGNFFYDQADGKKFSYRYFQQNTIPKGTQIGYISGVIVKGDHFIELKGKNSKEGTVLINIE